MSAAGLFSVHFKRIIVSEQQYSHDTTGVASNLPTVGQLGDGVCCIQIKTDRWKN